MVMMIGLTDDDLADDLRHSLCLPSMEIITWVNVADHHDRREYTRDRTALT